MTPSSTVAPDAGRRSPVALAAVTTFRLGGPAALQSCPDEQALEQACRELVGEPFTVLGQGSNVLVSDEGVEGVVLRAFGPLRILGVEETAVEVAATSRLDELSAHAAGQGWAGLEFAAGLPGTVGGAAAGNSGAFGAALGDLVAGMTVLDRSGRKRRIRPAAAAWGYRRSPLSPDKSTVLTVTLRIGRGAPAALLAQREAVLARRRGMHPDWRRLPCAGSVFRNPPGGLPAGRLLEDAGAKGLRRGGVRVWEGHANIIVRDREDGSALEAYELARALAALVRDRQDVELTPEIRFLGVFPPW